MSVCRCGWGSRHSRVPDQSLRQGHLCQTVRYKCRAVNCPHTHSGNCLVCWYRTHHIPHWPVNIHPSLKSNNLSLSKHLCVFKGAVTKTILRCTTEKKGKKKNEKTKMKKLWWVISCYQHLYLELNKFVDVLNMQFSLSPSFPHTLTHMHARTHAHAHTHACTQEYTCASALIWHKLIASTTGTVEAAHCVHTALATSWRSPTLIHICQHSQYNILTNWKWISTSKILKL